MCGLSVDRTGWPGQNSAKALANIISRVVYGKIFHVPLVSDILCGVNVISDLSALTTQANTT